MTNPDLTVSAAFDRQLFWRGGQSVRYLVARVKASQPESHVAAERPALNIALVIDASGSMAGGKLEAAKQAALGLAERLAERDRLTVVSFASDVVTHLDALPVTAENSARIRGEIMGLRTRGMTCLSGGWFAGVECAARVAEEDSEMTARAIILSDGLANEGITAPDELGEHAGELRKRGVLTSTLGIGDGYDEQLLRAIAENGGGRLHDAELAADIRAVLHGELDDILETLVEDARIALEAPASVTVEPVGHAAVERDGRRTSVAIGPVQGGVERCVVFKLRCPKARCDEKLSFSVSASGRAADDGATLAADAGALALTAARGETNNAQARSEELSQLVCRVWNAQIVANAARMNRDGGFRSAQQYIEKEFAYFTRYVKGLESSQEMLDMVENLLMLGRRVAHPLSSRLHKEVMMDSLQIRDSRMDWRHSVRKTHSWKERLDRGE